MYVTRPLSLYFNSPNTAAEPPPDGPNSGILVIQDKEAEEQTTRFFGLFQTSKISRLPFPQNKKIKVQYSTGVGDQRRTYTDKVYFIPVINQPLSSNRYYVIRADKKYKGNTCTCSKEEDATTCCLCTSYNDVKPRPFDHRDIYQQVGTVPHSSGFEARAVASDGIPPRFLRRRNWKAYTGKQSHYTLGEALGLDAALRARMPGLDFPVPGNRSPSVVVGKWYCPYIFVKERGQLKEQMERSMFYEVNLVQFWEEIHACENYDGYGKAVEVSVSVKREEAAALNGSDDVVSDDFDIVDGVVWFKPRFLGNGLGLSMPVWERMRWEAARGGWVGGEKAERVERTETHGGEGGWRKFGCYVLVERFVLNRMDGSLAFAYDFRHTNKIQIQWG